MQASAPSELRRLNHLVGEDFYFLSYCLLVSLHVLSPRGAVFRDHRKLAHVIHFASDARLLNILERHKSSPIANPVDKELLFAAYTKAQTLKREIYKLVLSMHRRQLIDADPSSVSGAIDVSLREESLPADFLTSEFFAHERANVLALKLLVPRLGIMSLETFIDRLYVNKGVRAWAL